MLTGVFPFKLGAKEKLVSHELSEHGLVNILITKRDFNNGVVAIYHRHWQFPDGRDLVKFTTYESLENE